MKEIIKQMREEIAQKENEQKTIKPQRKTVHFTGTRTIDPEDAYNKVIDNKFDLRIMYAAYNLLRGKKFEITESNSKPIDREEYYKLRGYYPNPKFEGKHPLTMYLPAINNVLNRYGFKLPYKEEETKDWFGNKKLEKIFDLENYEKIIRIGE
jgi:hypothetical protein